MKNYYPRIVIRVLMENVQAREKTLPYPFGFILKIAIGRAVSEFL